MNVTALARPEIIALRSYKPTKSHGEVIRLNANEAPAALENGAANGINRYPLPRATALSEKMAVLYGVSADNVVVTRGSSEGIDLLIRSFCSAGRDEVLITPPAFEMYSVYASIQGAKTVEVPLQADANFALDIELLLDSCSDQTKLIFLCSPNNPVGTIIPEEKIVELLQARANKSIVVVDEAYIEFSDEESMSRLVSTFDNLVVLRTLSKAFALAGARCGAVIAAPAVAELLNRVLAPYALSSLVIDKAEAALSSSNLGEVYRSIATIIAERKRLNETLAANPGIEKIWPSAANFLFLRIAKFETVLAQLEAENIAVRTYLNDPVLRACIRLTVGSKNDNNRLIRALR